MKYVICAGYKYTDIDVLASSLALKNLMNLCGERASVHLTGPFNATIPKGCKYWDTKDVLKTIPNKSESTHFMIVDISNPQHFERFVDIEKVNSVYDHHYGYEEFWKTLIREKAKIEPVGACATLIWEDFKAHKLCHRVSSSSANLLYTAIISNTLNFKAQVSSVRDEVAAKELSHFISLPTNWITQYYKLIENSLVQDIHDLIHKDTKKLTLCSKSLYFSQIEVWNAQALMNQYNFFKLMSDIFPARAWLLNLISIEEGYNYIFTNSENLENKLGDVVTYKKEASYLKTEKLWMRKEIIKTIKIN